CRDQEAFERGLRARMRALPAPEVPAGLEDRVRRRIRRRALPAGVSWLPLAAGIVIALLWGRGAPPFVAWEVARDHLHCFSRDHLPAHAQSVVWPTAPAASPGGSRSGGPPLPLAPPAGGGGGLGGGRFPPLMARGVPPFT